jgi:hypothetical protein
VPTFFRSVSFLNDWHALSPDEKRQFKTAVRQMVDDLRTKQGFRRELRIKRVRTAKGVFEMTWTPDGRATFQYGQEVHPGEPHIIWRRIGGHEIFKNP